MKKLKPGDRVMVRERFQEAYYETEIIADVNFDGRAKDKYLVAGVDFEGRGHLPARTLHADCISKLP